MNLIKSPILKTLAYELNFTARDRTVWLWMVIVFCLSSISVVSGLVEVRNQNAAIQTLIDLTKKDRLAESEKQKDWGSAAYYIFDLTYQPPSDFAFAALGQRDNQAWKHRIRMLALEGQVYERDVGNPSIALIGRFDFSFFVAFVFPLVLIMLLYDLRSSELTAGRYNLLESTAKRPTFFWLSRAFLRSTGVFLCLIIPMIIAGLIAGTNLITLLLASLFVFVFALFWTLICYKLSKWRKPGSVILMTLVGVWLFTAVVFPSGARIVIDKMIPLPSGADILMLQRETVNDAWDLPKEVTMDAFFERYPKWSDYKPKPDSFDWPWYYAFQQVGDQKSEPLATAYHDGRLLRDLIAAWTSVLAPSSLLERSLQSLANTSVRASIAYEDRIRSFHTELREFYYPKLFRNEPFDKPTLEKLPKFDSER